MAEIICDLLNDTAKDGKIMSYVLENAVRKCLSPDIPEWGANEEKLDPQLISREDKYR